MPPLLQATVVHAQFESIHPFVADTGAYFQQLDAYCSGNLEPLLDAFTVAAAVAAEESRWSAEMLLSLPGEWAELSTSRAGSAASAVVDQLLDHPVLTTDSAERVTGASESAIYAALAR